MAVPSSWWSHLMCPLFVFFFFCVCSELFRVQQDAFKTTIKLVPWSPSTLISMGRQRRGERREFCVALIKIQKRMIAICMQKPETLIASRVAYLKIWSGTLKIRLIMTSGLGWSCSDDNLFACHTVEALLIHFNFLGFFFLLFYAQISPHWDQFLAYSITGSVWWGCRFMLLMHITREAFSWSQHIFLIFWTPTLSSSDSLA